MFPTPTWVALAPEEEVWLVDNLSSSQKLALEKSIREIPLGTTFRTWVITAMEKCCELIEDPWASLRRPAFDINQTIFDTKTHDMYTELQRRITIRRKTIDEIFPEEIALVINFFLCRQLHSLTGFPCRNAWMRGSSGDIIKGTIVEVDMRLDDEFPVMSYAVQTIGGTPWTFFKTLSTHYPELRFTVSDVDTRRSIIQMKIYHKGRTITTMATEETSAIKHLDIHTAQAFGGVYFYLPLN